MIHHPMSVSDFVQYNLSLKFNSMQRVMRKTERLHVYDNYIDITKHIPLSGSIRGDSGISDDDMDTAMYFLDALYRVVYIKKSFMHFICTGNFQMGFECSDEIYSELAPLIRDN